MKIGGRTLKLAVKLNVTDHCARLTSNIGLYSMYHGTFAALRKLSADIDHCTMHKSCTNTIYYCFTLSYDLDLQSHPIARVKVDPHTKTGESKTDGRADATKHIISLLRSR